MEPGDWLQTSAFTSKKTGETVYGVWNILTGRIAVRIFLDEEWKALRYSSTSLDGAAKHVQEYASEN